MGDRAGVKVIEVSIGLRYDFGRCRPKSDLVAQNIGLHAVTVPEGNLLSHS